MRIGGARAIKVAVATSAAALAVAGCGTVSTHTVTVTRGAASGASRPITLPSTLGGFEDLIAAEKASGADRSALSSQRANQAHVESATVAAYRRAYAGAAAAYHGYANADETLMPFVIAVRAPSPGMVIGPVVKAAYLGLARPPQQVIDVGPVQCQVQWTSSTRAGHRPPPSSELLAGCQRGGAQLTVFTGGFSGLKGPSGVARAVAFTNAAFAAAGG